MSRVEAYRNYAAECLALAKRTPNERERQLLVEMAAGWHELAEMLRKFMDEHDGMEPDYKRLESQPRKEKPAH